MRCGCVDDVRCELGHRSRLPLKSNIYHTNRVLAGPKGTMSPGRLLRTMQSSRLKSNTPGDEEEDDDDEVDHAEYLGKIGRMFVISKKEEDHL